MVWITTSSPAVPSAYNWQFSVETFARSVLFGFWSPYYELFWNWAVAAGPAVMAMVFFGASAIFLLAFHQLRRDEYGKPRAEALCFALLVAICIAAPTVVLETLSDVWTPGTRWPMLMQFWSPFVFCIAMFTALALAPDRFWWPAWKAITAGAAAFTIVLALGFNHTQVLSARQERAWYTELQGFITQDRMSGVSFPRHYLIHFADSPPFLPLSPMQAAAYARTILGRDVTFSVIDTVPEAADRSTVLVWKDQHFSRSLPARAYEKRLEP
jgi:hypothetical protein